MSGWNLQLKTSIEVVVDASPIAVKSFASMSLKQIESLTLRAEGTDVSLGDLFKVTHAADQADRIVVDGDLSRFRHLAADHSHGEFFVEGNGGDFLASGMRGGYVFVSGNVGDHVAAASGASKVGISGGRIEIAGRAGAYAGHRIRRGELFIGGDVGPLAGAHMVAGTMVVGGRLGKDPALAMRRGTLIAGDLPELPEGRYTLPLEVQYLFASLIRSVRVDAVRSLLDRLRSGGISRRGDRAVAGQGEIVAPVEG